MAVGGFFLLIVIVVVVGAIGVGLWLVRAGLWKSETDPGATETENDPRRAAGPGGAAGGATQPDGQRPEHSSVDDPGDHTFVGR